MASALPRLVKKSIPPVVVRSPRKSPDFLLRYHRHRLTDLRKFEQRLRQFEVKSPELIARHRELMDWYRYVFGRRPVRTRPIQSRHRQWILANPEHAPLELFRLEFTQQCENVEWPS